MQLSHFAGITRDYIAFIETQRLPPSKLKYLFDELQTDFENVEALTDEEEDLSDPIQNTALLKEFKLRIEEKEAQLYRLGKKLAELKKRHRNLKLLKRVSSDWKAKKLDLDPDILVKMGPIESGIKVEIRRCGPAVSGCLSCLCVYILLFQTRLSDVCFWDTHFLRETFFVLR